MTAALWAFALPAIIAAGAVDVSQHEVLALHWRKQLVREGLDRGVRIHQVGCAIVPPSELVVAATGEGVVLGLDWSTGEERWRFDNGVAFEGPITALSVPLELAPSGTLALVSSEAGILWALDAASGKPLWRTPIGAASLAPVTTSPASPTSPTSDDALFVTTAKDELLRLSLRTGQVAWRRSGAARTSLTVHGHAAATASAELVVTAFADGRVAAYDVGDGRERWSQMLESKGARFSDADATPVIWNDLVLAASYASGVYALAVSDGSIRWHTPDRAVARLALWSPAGGPGAATNAVVVSLSAQGEIEGVVPSTGEVVYRTKVAVGDVSDVVWVGPYAAAITSDGLLLFDPASGEPVQSYSLGARAHTDFSWGGGRLAAVSETGALYLLGQPPKRPRFTAAVRP